MVLVSCLIVFLLFLIFSDLTFFWLLLILIPVMIYGFYLNHDIRKVVSSSSHLQVRSRVHDHVREDPFAGAVRVWLESVLVFCRLAELLGRVFTK